MMNIEQKESSVNLMSFMNRKEICFKNPVAFHKSIKVK